MNDKVAECETEERLKKIQKKRAKRLKILIQKQQEEVKKFHRIWEEKRERLEKEHKLEPVCIRPIHGQALVAIDKLKLLDSVFAKKMEEFKRLTTFILKILRQINYLQGVTRDKRQPVGLTKQNPAIVNLIVYEPVGFQSEDKKVSMRRKKSLFESKTRRYLNDDLILEVISRLPLKDAIRCKSLNKNFHTYISHQEHKYFDQSNRKICRLLYCSDPQPKIFRQLRLDPPYLPEKLDICEILPIIVQVTASCSGLLLLQFLGHFNYGLFNPFTGEFQLVPVHLHDGPIGLAVISSTQSCSSRLVAVQVKRHHTITEKKVFKFTTYSTSSCMWEETHEEDLVCKSSEFVSTNTLPVFLGNSLHWLIEDGRILAFDLEKRRARIINGPVVKTVGMRFEYDVWFGGVQDSLVFVYFSRYKIVIYVYDFEKTKWDIQHIFDNIGRTVNNDFRNGIPMLFNGEQLFFLARKSEIMERVIYMHDISTKSWEEIGKMPETTDSIQRYIPFFPTLVKLNSGNFYQHDSTLNPDIRGSFHGLHQLSRHMM